MTLTTIRRGAGAAAAIAFVLLPCFAGAAGPASGAPARPTASGGSRLSAPMPDSVLARVFTGTGAGDVHLITRRQMAVAAQRSGRPPESLTPKDRREFLDVLVDQAVLLGRVRHEPRRWEHQDSTDWNLLRDRLVLRTALDSAMVELNFERAGRGDSLLTPQEAGIVLRDREVAKLAPEWNEAALKKAVTVFDTLPRPTSRMSMIEQIRVAGARPTLAPGDSTLVLARASVGDYTLGDLVADFVRLNPMYRPRVESVDNVKELVANVFFERALREAALARGLEQRPDIAAALRDRAEYLDLQRFVAREVYAKIAMDSLTLQKYFRTHGGEFDFDERAQVVRMVFPTREEAEAMVQRLTIPDEAESLAARSSRAGVPYATVVNANSDTALFRRVRSGGVGVVLGPDSTMQGWRAMRVMAIEPRRPRRWEQAQDMVRTRWYDVEGERRMRALLDDLRSHAVIVPNEKALAKPLEPAGPVRR